MGLDDRDYMRRDNRPPRNGPWRDGKLLVQPPPFGFAKKALVFLGVVVALTWVFHHYDIGASGPWMSSFSTSTPRIAMPETGNVTLFQLGQIAPGVADFTVIASRSTTGLPHHIVKLSDAISGAPVLSLFVRNGETATVKVPLGTFKVKMAQGNQWFGETRLFGTDMRVNQGLTPFTFSSDGRSITGHTLRLEDRIEGNYPTRQISADNF
jgi:hypothetical protein